MLTIFVVYQPHQRHLPLFFLLVKRMRMRMWMIRMRFSGPQQCRRRTRLENEAKKGRHAKGIIERLLPIFIK